MKFICSCETLKREIGYAINFTSKRNALSISSNVLLENNNNVLTIKSTDTKNGFIGSIEVETIIPGSTTVICEKLLDVLKNISSDLTLEISEENDKLSIRNNAESRFLVNIRTISSDKYPELLTIEDDEFFTIGQHDFFSMIDKTLFAVSHDEARYFLTGVYMEKKDDKLVMVATDGKRLACSKKAIEHDIPTFNPVILPPAFLANLKSIGSGDGVLSLAIRNGYVFANIEGHMIYSLLITGNYPAYERVIPKSFENRCIADTSDMLNAINLISVMIEMKSKKIYFEINNQGIMVSGEDNDGDSKNIIHCQYDGPETKLCFNYNFLQDAVKKIDGKNFALCFNNASSAIGILAEPEDDNIFIIMPMQS